MTNRINLSDDGEQLLEKIVAANPGLSSTDEALAALLRESARAGVDFEQLAPANDARSTSPSSSTSPSAGAGSTPSAGGGRVEQLSQSVLNLNDLATLERAGSDPETPSTAADLIRDRYGVDPAGYSDEQELLKAVRAARAGGGR